MGSLYLLKIGVYFSFCCEMFHIINCGVCGAVCVNTNLFRIIHGDRRRCCARAFFVPNYHSLVSKNPSMYNIWCGSEDLRCKRSALPCDETGQGGICMSCVWLVSNVSSGDSFQTCLRRVSPTWYKTFDGCDKRCHSRQTSNLWWKHGGWTQYDSNLYMVKMLSTLWSIV